MNFSGRRIDWKHVLAVVMFMVSIALLALTPHFNQTANLSRVTPGYGGECLLWFFPLLAGVVLSD